VKNMVKKKIMKHNESYREDSRKVNDLNDDQLVEELAWLKLYRTYKPNLTGEEKIPCHLFKGQYSYDRLLQGMEEMVKVKGIDEEKVNDSVKEIKNRIKEFVEGKINIRIRLKDINRPMTYIVDGSPKEMKNFIKDVMVNENYEFINCIRIVESSEDIRLINKNGQKLTRQEVIKLLDQNRLDLLFFEGPYEGRYHKKTVSVGLMNINDLIVYEIVKSPEEIKGIIKDCVINKRYEVLPGYSNDYPDSYLMLLNRDGQELTDQEVLALLNKNDLDSIDFDAIEDDILKKIIAFRCESGKDDADLLFKLCIEINKNTEPLPFIRRSVGSEFVSQYVDEFKEFCSQVKESEEWQRNYNMPVSIDPYLKSFLTGKFEEIVKRKEELILGFKDEVIEPHSLNIINIHLLRKRFEFYKDILRLFPIFSRSILDLIKKHDKWVSEHFIKEWDIKEGYVNYVNRISRLNKESGLKFGDITAKILYNYLIRNRKLETNIIGDYADAVELLIEKTKTPDAKDYKPEGLLAKLLDPKNIDEIVKSIGNPVFLNYVYEGCLPAYSWSASSGEEMMRALATGDYMATYDAERRLIGRVNRIEM